LKTSKHPIWRTLDGIIISIPVYLVVGVWYGGGYLAVQEYRFDVIVPE
jgi:hypothetical protein